MAVIYLLVESHHEGAYTHSVYETKRAAYKSMLLLMKKRVTEALDFYRLTGEEAAEYRYRNHSDRLTVCEDKVWQEDELPDKPRQRRVIKTEFKATKEHLLKLVVAADNTISNGVLVEAVSSKCDVCTPYHPKGICAPMQPIGSCIKCGNLPITQE